MTDEQGWETLQGDTPAEVDRKMEEIRKEITIVKDGQQLKLSPVPIKRPEEAPPINRLTYITNIHREIEGEDPTNLAAVSSIDCEFDDQTWSRKIEVGLDWQPFELGWVPPDHAGVVTIQNLQGKDIHLRPSDEIKAQSRDKIIEVRLEQGSTNYLYIPPFGFCQPFWCAYPGRIEMRSPNGKVRAWVNVFPK